MSRISASSPGVFPHIPSGRASGRQRVATTDSGATPFTSTLRRRSRPVFRFFDRRLNRDHPPRSEPSSRDPRAFVRARPKYVLVEERLAYEQAISRNRSTSLRRPPTGRIRISVPYDGGTCFGPDAHDDAERVLRGNGRL